MRQVLVPLLFGFSVGCSGSAPGNGDGVPPGIVPVADSSNAHAAPAFIQANYGEAFPLTQCSVAFDDPVTAGSLLVVVIRMSNGGRATVTSGGRTFDLDKRQLPNSNWSFEIHSLANAAGGATTITANVTGGGDQIRMSILEFSGVATSSPVHQTSGARGIGRNISAGNVTTTIENGLLVFAAATDSDEFHSQPTPGSGYTLVVFSQLEPNAPDKTAIEYQGPVTAGTYSGAMTDDQTPIWAAILVAYKSRG